MLSLYGTSQKSIPKCLELLLQNSNSHSNSDAVNNSTLTPLQTQNGCVQVLQTSITEIS